MKFCVQLVIAALIFCCFAPLTHAQNASSQNSADGIIFDAENATIKGYDQKNQVIELKNKVQIIFHGQYISCDDAKIDTKNSAISCRGHVRLVSQEARLEADEIALNYKTNTGEIKNGFVQVGQVLFEGESIKKLSSTEYETVQGRYTACTNCPPFWSFRGSKVDAEIGGYAYIKNATIYFGRVPALWFPYLVVPIKSKRQTGFLFPNYKYTGSGGFTIQESFFWAMSDNQDSTLSAEYYTKRGTKGLLNYRYVLSEDSSGEFNFGYMKDKYFSNSVEVAPYNPQKKLLDRWAIKYNHQYILPYGFVHRMDINTTSDTFYPKDFPEEMPGRGDSSLENHMSLTKNTESVHWNLDTSYYRSLLNRNPLESNSTSVHRFPAMNLSFMPVRLFDSNFLFDMNANYTNFVRDNVSYDDLDNNRNPVTPDGKFDPQTDLIRTGQRLDLEPTLSYPITFNEAINFTPSVSYRETRYQFPLGSEPSTYRRYVRTNMTLNTHFSRIFGDFNNPLSDRYKHVIQPEISYSVIPWSQHPDHPFFGTSDFEPNYKKDQPVNNNDNIQFDYFDRIYDKNVVTYSLTNKLWRKRWVHGTPDYQQIFRYKIWQSYDIYEDHRVTDQKKQPWSEISNLLDIRIDNFETNFLLKYYPYQNATANATRVRLYNDRQDYIQMTYSQDFLITNGATVDLNSKTEDFTLGVGFNVKYMELIGQTTYDLIKDNFQSYGYMLKFKPPGNCWAIIFSQERSNESEIKYKLNMSFLFDGKTESGIGSQNNLNI